MILRQEKQITLGIDIGTQYCSAGYVLDQEYHQIDFDGSVYGVPTAACLEDDKIFVGNNAVKLIPNFNNSGTGNIYMLPPEQSIKTLLRNNEKTAVFYNRLHKAKKEKNIDELVKKFVSYLAKEICDSLYNNLIQNGCSYKISINVAYPGNIDENQYVKDYADNIRNIVEIAFKNEIKNVKKNANAYSIEKVNVISESELAANLMENIFVNTNDAIDGSRIVREKKICTIDVGAGTTDLAFLEWNEEKQKYLCKSQITSNFGGKSIDFILTKKDLNWGNDIINPDYKGTPIVRNETSPDMMVEYKKWLYSESGDIGQEIEDHKKNRTKIVNMIGDFISDFKVLGNNQSYRSLLNVIKKFVKDNNLNTNDNKFILMGGSSNLPYVIQAIAKVAPNCVVKTQKLEDMLKYTPLNYINNSNFIARAAAGYNNSKITTNYYALSYYDENKKVDGYKIISSKGNLDGHYYDTKSDYMIGKDGKPCNFIINGIVHVIKVCETDAMGLSYSKEDFYFIKCDKKMVYTLENNRYYWNKEKMLSGDKYNIGCVIANNGEKLSIQVFDNEDNNYSKIEKSEFIKQAYTTADNHNNETQKIKLTNVI